MEIIELGLQQSKQKAALFGGECLLVVDEFEGGKGSPNYFVIRWPASVTLEEGLQAVTDSWDRLSSSYWQPQFPEYRDSSTRDSRINFSLVIDRRSTT